MKESGMPNTSILVVDDTPANLRLLSQMLSQRGYKVRVANSGARALESIKANPPDLILLDIMMLEMNGYEVCQRLKAEPLTRDIPIIFISALDATEDKVNAFVAGGVDYVTKPFQFEEVLARVQTHLALRDLQKQLQVANRELEQKVEELEARNAELDAFAHTVAHDLKNPLNIVLGYADLLESADAVPEEEVRYSAKNIVRGARKMDGIIESLLLLAGVRKQEVEFAPLDMGDIVPEIQHRLAHQIEGYQAEIILPETWPVAWGYAPWVEEVWANYISNAIKYGGQPPRVELGSDGSASQRVSETSASSAELSADRRIGEPSLAQRPSENRSIAHSHIRFWVRDNGPGLSPEEQAQLFTPFTRIHKSRAEGHGLGLSIVQRIVEKLGGEVGVESQVGQGSLFWFTLPAPVFSPTPT